MADKSFTVLLVDNDEHAAKTFRDYFDEIDSSWGVELTHLEDPTGVPRELSNRSFDIIISEYDFDDVTGLDLVEEINNLNWEKPIIIVTNEGSEKVAARALRHDVTDYRIKDELTPQNLKRSIERALRKYLQSSRQQKKEKKLKQEAGEDDVTGLDNRRLLRKKIQESIRNAKNNNDDLSLFMFALKNFDQINAIHGQETGDRILETIGDFIRANVREEDHVGRYQGVEFCISMPRTPKSKAKMLAKRFLNQFKTELESIEDQYNVSIAYGGTIVERKAGENEIDTLMKRAVEKLYQAKVDVNQNQLVVS